jgi:hypothetical protein
MDTLLQTNAMLVASYLKNINDTVPSLRSKFKQRHWNFLYWILIIIHSTAQEMPRFYETGHRKITNLNIWTSPYRSESKVLMTIKRS